MKILITGATGFIGKELIHYLSTFDGIKIIASSTGATPFINNYKNVVYIPANIETIVKTEKNLFEYFKKPDLVIHLSWKNLPNYNEQFHIDENLRYNFLFLSKLIDQGLKNITVVGTCLEYGLKEGELKESDIVNPTTKYGQAKLELFKKLNKIDNISLKWVRLFYVYGENQNVKALYPCILEAISKQKESFDMSSGEQIRDFISIKKVVKYLYLIAKQTKYTGVVNCSSGEGVKVIDFVNHFFKKQDYNPNLNKKYSIPDYEPFKFWGNNDYLKKIISLPNE